MEYLPNYNKNCNNTVEWAENIEKQVESEILKISVNLSEHKPKAKKNKLEIMGNQADKEKKKLKRLYGLYADGNDMVIEMIKDLEGNISALEEQIKEERKRSSDNQKSFVYENIKNLADIWEKIDKTRKNKILKSIIEKIVIVNGNVEIQLKNF